jgi:sugar phosphate isomerase/epimerase
MNPLWVSLSTYGGVTTRQALDMFWAAGIRHVELAIGAKPSSDTTDALQHYRQQGMEYRAHHAIVWQEHRSFNLAQTFDRDYFERLTDWMVTLNIQAYSVHPGSVSTVDSDDRGLHHIGQLAQLCQERSIRLGVETMYPTPCDRHRRELLQNLSQIEQFLKAVPQIELVVDLAHLNLWHHCSTSEKLQVLRLAANRILEIHVSDNDGERDNHTAITEETWWLPYRAELPLTVPIVLESRMNDQGVEQINQQVQRIQALFNPAEALK